MARITDPERIERIKKASMALIVDNGYTGVTISSIAQKAEVSTGYLYRHFDSKEALINALVNESFSSLKNSIGQRLESTATVRDIVTYHFRTLLSIANETPIKARFVCSLANDSRYNGRDILGISPLAQRAIDKGLATGEIGSHVSAEMVLLFLVNLPISFMSKKLSSTDFKGISDEEIALLTEMCLKALA